MRSNGSAMSKLKPGGDGETGAAVFAGTASAVGAGAFAGNAGGAALSLVSRVANADGALCVLTRESVGVSVDLAPLAFVLVSGAVEPPSARRPEALVDTGPS